MFPVIAFYAMSFIQLAIGVASISENFQTFSGKVV